MYSIVRNNEYYLCDKTTPPGEKMRIDSNGNTVFKLSPIWQKFDNEGFPYIEEFIWNATTRKEKLEQIYLHDTLSVIKLSDSQLEKLSFKKLKYY